MPGSSNCQPNKKPGMSIKKEPESSSASGNTKDLKGSLETLRISGSRLPSFRGPRDLTLSALASSSSILQPQSRAKKTFLPNIPVRREKGERVIESRSEKSSKKDTSKGKQGERGRGRGRGRGREKEFIQTRGSLFGDGIAAAAPVRRNAETYRGFEGSSRAGEMQKPVLNPDAAYNIDKDLEEKKLKEILRDDFIDDPDEVKIVGYMPVQLPLLKMEMQTTKGDKINNKIEDEMENEMSHLSVNVKQEPGLHNDSIQSEKKKSNERVDAEPASLDKTFKFPKDSVAYSLMTKRENEFIQIQLPTCLPGHPPDVPETPSSDSSGIPFANQSQRSYGNDAGMFSSSTPRCTLDTLPEGLIGNMRIYESGKVELCLGEHVFKVDKGTPVGFLRDVAKIEVNQEEKTGNMVVLGHVQDRFVVTLDFEDLIKKLKKL